MWKTTSLKKQIFGKGILITFSPFNSHTAIFEIYDAFVSWRIFEAEISIIGRLCKSTAVGESWKGLLIKMSIFTKDVGNSLFCRENITDNGTNQFLVTFLPILKTSKILFWCEADKGCYGLLLVDSGWFALIRVD